MYTNILKTTRRVLLGSLVACAAIAAPVAYAADTPAPRPRKPFVWTPPPDSAPSNLSSGAARGGCEKDQNLFASVLAPNSYIGTTTRESPVLFWYTTKPTIMKIRVTMVKDNDLNDPKPLFNVVYRDSLAAGIQSINLSSPLPVMDSEDKIVGEPKVVKLEEGVKYRWSIHLCSPDGASSDVVSEAVIQRIKPPADIASALGTGDDYEKAGAYAKAHVWYDMLSTLSTLIEKNPGDAMLRAQRTKLLKSEKLPPPLKDGKDWAVPPGM